MIHLLIPLQNLPAKEAAESRKRKDAKEKEKDLARETKRKTNIQEEDQIPETRAERNIDLRSIMIVRRTVIEDENKSNKIR